MSRRTASSGRFTIHYDEPLGQGSFGTVHKAFDNETGMTVAVKATRLMQNRSAMDSITSEFQVLTSLSHPSIVQVFSLDLTDNELRVFMEWMPGGSVQSLMQRTGFRLHEGVIRKYIHAALKGLAYLHSRSIVHLDLKPANMLVTADGNLKLADFGTTKWLVSGTTSMTTQQMIGTPAFMAPEIITSGKYSMGSDMWAIGCCVVQMATGKMPWHHTDPDIHNAALPLMFYIASRKPPEHMPDIPRHISSQLRNILQQCFSLNVSVRPTADQLLRDPYFTCDALPMDAEPVASFGEALAIQRADVAPHHDQGTFQCLVNPVTLDFGTS
jgi:serine/threonine protein kinase